MIQPNPLPKKQQQTDCVNILQLDQIAKLHRCSYDKTKSIYSARNQHKVCQEDVDASINRINNINDIYNFSLIID